jgi:hypothetical protein
MLSQYWQDFGLQASVNEIVVSLIYLWLLKTFFLANCE